MKTIEKKAQQYADEEFDRSLDGTFHSGNIEGAFREGAYSVISEIRQAVAEYIHSEGCSCCRGADHGQHEEKLAILLSVEKYDDGNGYNWGKYRLETDKIIN